MRKDDTSGDSTLMRVYGRKLFFETAKEMLDRKESGYYILSCINIDNFKVINAQYGTAVGDSVLMHVAQCVSRCMESIGGICGHISGDNFVAMFPASYAASRLLAENYCTASSPDCIPGKIRLRVGRLVVEMPLSSVDAIYDCAKIAAVTIRGNYEKNIEYYKEYMQQDLVEQQQIIFEMRDALGCGQFEPWFQPQYNHATGALIGAEVLVRWNKNGTYVPPNEFVPIFERNGFIYEMDKYIWEQACLFIRRRLDEGRRVLPLSVNISRRDILHEDFINVLSALIKKYNIGVDMLRPEITETAFAEQSREIIEKVTQLTELGYVVEIDDFGSGYSSLNTLKDVPASILKIDMRFFESTENSQRAGNIIESVVRMAKRLDMAVIAEGVEDKAQADYLKSIGCYYIQGFYYAKPMPLADYETLLDNSELERELSRLKTVKNFDNNEFWNPKSMDTLIFNSYVGGACIFEYYNGKTDILRLNDEYIGQFGGIIPEGTELHGAAVSKHMDEKGRKILFSTIDRAVATRREASCEVKVSDGGQTEYIRVTVRAIARADDRILCYGVVVNMTEQRAAEINERNMTTQLDTILGSIHASVTATVFDGDEMKVIFKNNGFYSMYGYTREQYDNEVTNIIDLILPEDREKTAAKVRQIVSGRQTETYEFRARKRDGDIVWVQMTNSVVSLDGISDCVLLGIGVDVTYLHMLKNAGEEAADKLRAVLNNADSGITAAYISGEDINFLIANDKFYEIHGISRGGSRSVNRMLELTHTEDREYVRQKISEAIKTGRNTEFEYRVVRPDGRVARIKAAVSTTNISGFDLPIQITIYSDVTEEWEHNMQLSFLNETAHEILAQPDCDKAVIHTLEKIRGYFAAERAYVIETDSGGDTVSSTYEVCAPGISREIERLQHVPAKVVDAWFYGLQNERVIVVEDVEKLGDGQRALKIILEEQNIRSIIIAPLWRDGRLEGFVGVDNPSRQANHLVHLAAIGDYIAVLLTRRDLTARLEGEKNQFMEIVNNIPGGFVRLKLNEDGKYVPVHISDGITELLQMDMQKLHKIYGTDVLNGVHPEDVEIAAQAGREMLEKDATESGNYRVLDGSGGYTRIMMSGKASRDYMGQVYLNFYVGANESVISEQKDKEMLDNLACGAAMYEFDGSRLATLHINKIYKQMTGHTDIGPDTDLFAENYVHPEDGEKTIKEIRRAIAENRDANGDIRIRYGADGYRRFHVNARIRKKGDGKHLLYAIYSRSAD